MNGFNSRKVQEKLHKKNISHGWAMVFFGLMYLMWYAETYIHYRM